MISDEELAEMQRRVDAAAAGPWTVGNHASDACRIDGAGVDGMVIYDEGGHDEEDAIFIAHARTDVPRLIAALRAERAEVGRLRSLVEQHHDVGKTGHVDDWGKRCRVCPAPTTQP